ncbi:MAG: glycosyltransferase family 39 protein [Candidatus Auribacterota bacterium]
MKSMTNKYLYLSLLLITGLGSFLLFYHLGARPLYNPDEGRYTQIACEMIDRNDWVEPRLYNLDYLAKPVLFYWLTIISFKIFGISEFAGRFMPALFALFGVIATFFFVKKVVNLRAAFFSALVLVLNFWYIQVGRFMVIDMVFSFFIVSSLYLFYLGLTEKKHKKVYYPLFYASLALAFLTKGLACFFLVGIPIGGYLIATGNIKVSSRKRYHLLGLFIFAVIAGSWLIHIIEREPEFLWLFIVHEHLSRFTSNDFEHQQPWFFYLVLTPLLLTPWTFFVGPLQLLFSKFKNDHKNLLLYLLFSGGGIILFFSVSQTKLPTYCVPALPFFCILIGTIWSKLTDELRTSISFYRKTLAGSIILIVISLAVTIVSLFFFDLFEAEFPIRKELLAASGIYAASAFACLFFLKKRLISGIFYTLSVMMCLILIPVNNGLSNVVDKLYTTKHFAETLKPMLKSTDRVFIYGNPTHFYDLQYYLGHPVKLVGLKGELKPKYVEEDIKEDEIGAYIPDENFNSLLLNGKPFYCISRKKDLRRLSASMNINVEIVHENPLYVLFRSGKHQ